jgi:hypothetical protein
MIIFFFYLKLYQLIEDSLIRMNKLKEAILVTERHRAKKLTCLANLTELLTFEQIEQLLETNSSNLHAIIYFSRIEITSKVNCWLLLPGKGIAQFHQVSYKSFEKLFSIKKLKSLNNLFNEIQRSTNNQDQEAMLKNIYNLLIQPFEENLYDNLVLVNGQLQTKHLSKPILYIVYDEDMFKIPFHLLQTSKLSNTISNTSNETKLNYLFEIFEIDCAYSLKYFFKTNIYNHKFVKHLSNESSSPTSAANMPMRVISNEDDMQKLLGGAANNNKNNLKNSHHYQYDLLLLLVDSENKGQLLLLIDSLKIYIVLNKLNLNLSI